MKKRNKGFTLVELLAVVGIIAVLTVMAVPVFAAQLEKSREAVDLAHVRQAYAQVMTAAISGDTASPYHQADGSYLAEVPLSQKQNGWTTKMDHMSVGGVAYADDVHWLHAPEANGSCKIRISSGEVFLDWGSGTKAPVTPLKQTHINSTSAQDFLTKDILTGILPEDYPYTVINSNETVGQNGGTKKFLDYAAEKGFDLTGDYGAATWQIYVKDPTTKEMLEQPVIYWSSVPVNAGMVGKYIPVIGYRNGRYDVYMAKVEQYNKGTDYQYESIANNFANVTNADGGMGGNASFQFDNYDDAWAKYGEALSVYETTGNLTYTDMKNLGLTDK